MNLSTILRMKPYSEIHIFGCFEKCVEYILPIRYLSNKIEGEEKLFALESFLSDFTSLFCLQTLDMT